MTAFRATYSDWKLIKTRGVVQLVFEVPLHEADRAYQVVGGMPDAAAERWFGIARLKPESEVMPSNAVSRANDKTVPGQAMDKPSDRVSWHELKPSQQAGILCNDEGFQNFLKEKRPDCWKLLNTGTGFERAAEIVRSLCGVKSRSDITGDEVASRAWRNIVSDYRAWIREPEVV